MHGAAAGVALEFLKLNVMQDVINLCFEIGDVAVVVDEVMAIGPPFSRFSISAQSR